MKRSAILGAAVFATALLANETGSSISADAVIQRLKSGNARFVTGTSEHGNLSAVRRAQTAAEGQKPIATILDCSDSRVPVEQIFDQGVGDLFTIRVAGNVADTDEVGSVEYGVGHLGTPVLIVLGHTGCGAVTAVAKKAEVHGSIPALVDNIVPAVERVRKRTGAGKTDDAFIGLCIRENVFQSIADLLERSPELAARLREQKVKIIGALYHLEDGQVEWLGEHPEQGTLARPGGEHTASLAGMSLITGGLCAVVLGACFFLFVSDRRFFSSVKIRGRLFASFASFVLSAVVLVAQTIRSGNEIHSSFEMLAALGFPILVLGIGSVVFAMKHGSALDLYIQRLRQHIAKKAAEHD